MSFLLDLLCGILNYPGYTTGVYKILVWHLATIVVVLPFIHIRVAFAWKRGLLHGKLDFVQIILVQGVELEAFRNIKDF